MIFHRMFVNYTSSSVWVAEWPKKCPLSWPFVLIVFCLFVISIYVYCTTSRIEFLMVHQNEPLYLW